MKNFALPYLVPCCCQKIGAAAETLFICLCKFKNVCGGFLIDLQSLYVRDIKYSYFKIVYMALTRNT